MLYSAYVEGLTPDKPFKKSAKTVGRCISSFHSHGDTSIYDALVRLSQPWVMRYPLIDFQGNNGSIDGDGSASMRYTETRLHKNAMYMIEDIKRKVVPMKPNFAEDDEEPVVLPAFFPNLLVNPVYGIGVSIGSSFAPHNLNEMVEAIKMQMDNPKVSVEEIMTVMPGPDFPTGGIVANQKELIEAYKTGSGRALIRAAYEIEQDNFGNRIVITEMPYGVAKESLVAEIVALIEEEKLPEILDVRDLTDRTGIRVEIDFHEESDGHVVMQHIYKYTKAQVYYSYNQVALVDRAPVKLNLKQLIQIYLDSQLNNLKTIICFDSDRVKARINALTGFQVALNHIEEVVQIIKTSKKAEAAIKSLCEKFELQESQASAIVEMKLRRLTNLEQEEISNELAKVRQEYARLQDILNKPKALESEFKRRLDAMVADIGDERRTMITQAPTLNLNPKDLRKNGSPGVPIAVLLSESGNVKAIKMDTLKIEDRNAFGIKSLDYAIKKIAYATTSDDILCFTNLGAFYKIPANKIPLVGNGVKGEVVEKYLNLKQGEEILTIIGLTDSELDTLLLVATKQGRVKRVLMSDFADLSTRKDGSCACKLKDGDEVIKVMPLNPFDDVILTTKKGRYIRFDGDSISVVSRSAIGVIGIRLKDDDEVVGCTAIHIDSDNQLIVACRSGRIKRVRIKTLTKTNRGCQGALIIRPVVSSEEIVDIESASISDNVLIANRNTVMCMAVGDIHTSEIVAKGYITMKEGGVKAVLVVPVV